MSLRSKGKLPSSTGSPTRLAGGMGGMQSGAAGQNFLVRWVSQHPRLTLTLLVVGALGPFLAKPFNFDDPLFIWAAKQIQAHPANPFGLEVNWYGRAMPMWEVTQNPPLASYYIAMSATILGWSESALHVAFLLPAVLVILGTYRLARHFCERPLLAALATLFTPVFLVSSTTVMCDVIMLAFWIWATVLWVEGWAKEKSLLLAAAASLAALAVLTKYFALVLVPLLLAYSFFSCRGWCRRMLWLLIPVLALAGYQWWMQILYGQALLSEAANYAAWTRESFGVSRTTSAAIGLAFTGGCVAIVMFFAPLLWNWRSYLALVASGAVLALVPLVTGTLAQRYAVPLGGERAAMNIQFVFWAIGGLGVLALAIDDAWHHRNARATLLALWVWGTFTFAAFINWSITGRSVLPLTPAVGILLARRLNDVPSPGFRKLVPAFAMCAGLALLVTWSDFRLAVAARESAWVSVARLGPQPQARMFQGHWGFQFYMEALGLVALDYAKSDLLKPGDCVVVPLNNTNTKKPLNPDEWESLDALAVVGPRFLTTMSPDAGAGNYASVWGPLPFAFGAIGPEKVLITRLKPTK